MVKKKLKTRIKTKVKAKPKTSLKTRVKAKRNIKSKAKVKSQIKPKRKASPVKKVKSRPKLSSKKIKSIKVKSVIQFSDKQKNEFLDIVAKLINLHKSDKDGLKSLTQVERILDRYNQNYTDANEKFDAIVKYGMTEDPALVREHVFVPAIGKDKEINDIYTLLVKIGKGTIKYTELKPEIEKIYQDAQKSRR